jgi:hypothetical protein
MTAHELLLQMVFSEAMLQGGGQWARECEQRRVEFLGFAPQRKLERRCIGDWVRWGLTDPDAGVRLACVVQLLEHAERWAYSDAKVANRDIRVWHGATENGP